MSVCLSVCCQLCICETCTKSTNSIKDGVGTVKVNYWMHYYDRKGVRSECTPFTAEWSMTTGHVAAFLAIFLNIIVITLRARGRCQPWWLKIRWARGLTKYGGSLSYLIHFSAPALFVMETRSLGFCVMMMPVCVFVHLLPTLVLDLHLLDDAITQLPVVRGGVLSS